jgi:hypothetical protein
MLRLMSSQLKNILHFVAGGPTSLSHNLNWNGRPVRPDHIELSVLDSGATVSADAVNVTINTSVTVDILVESWHTIERTFGNRNLESLIPQPFIVGQGSPTPAFALGTTTIYARPASQGGSDTNGKGTLAKPYLTFQRAIRDVPNFPPPGARYIVDITGIGIEVLPDYYVLPNIQFPTIDYDNDTSIPYFYSGAGLRIRALLKPVSLSPAIDATITAATISEDTDTNLITLKISAPRATWTPANLKNKQLVRTGANTHKAACVIVDVLTNDTLVLTNNAIDFNGATGALSVAGGNAQIVEPSATLEGGVAPIIDYNNDPANSAFAGIVSTCNSIALQGLSITNRAGYTALAVMNCPNVPIEVCNVAGFFTQGQAGTYFTYANGCVMSYGLISVSSSFFCSACHFDSAPAGFDFFFYMVCATPQVFTNSIFSACSGYTSASQGGLPLICNTAFQNVLIDGSTGNAVAVTTGQLAFDHVQINNAQGKGVLAVERSNLIVNHLTGTGNLGAGLFVTDGSQAHVRDGGGSSIIGAGGEIVCGDLPNRTWANFYGVAPIGQQFDITAVGPAGATGTASRVFE